MKKQGIRRHWRLAIGVVATGTLIAGIGGGLVAWSGVSRADEQGLRRVGQSAKKIDIEYTKGPAGQPPLVDSGFQTFSAGTGFESTGFEQDAGDGVWVPGFVCGPEFAGCNIATTKDPDDNCGVDNPNPQGFWLSDGSRSCSEPHIDTINPYSGSQHLRYEVDNATDGRGDITPFPCPSGGAGTNTESCHLSLFSPIQCADPATCTNDTDGSGCCTTPLPIAPSTLTAWVAKESPISHFMQFSTQSPMTSGFVGARMTWDTDFGTLLIYKPGTGDVDTGEYYAVGADSYREMKLVADVCALEYVYWYDGMMLGTGPITSGLPLNMEHYVILTDNAPGVIDIDDIEVVRDPSTSPCDSICGNGIRELGEDCDGDDLGTDCIACESDCTCSPRDNKEPPCKCCKDVATAAFPDCARYCGAPVTEGDPVYRFSGEFYESVVDLRIRGRGPDFVWARKYRSKIGPNTVQGNGWDCSYNLKIEQEAPDLTLFDGNTRQDTYSLQPNGSWTAPGFFRVMTQNPNGSYTLTFGDTGIWNFAALDGNPAQGKITSIIDRNGNTLAFNYDGLGRLVTIHDTLDTAAHNRDITIAYNADGFIESITDYTGRQVKYEYYQDGDAGGSFGDLKSVTTPTVTGTPNGNDFPVGKETIYTYSKGFDDERLNHNLLTITDPKGQVYLKNTYASTEIPTDLNFDRVVRQVWGKPEEIIDFVYVPVTPSADNNFAVIKVIINDRVGNVSEHFFDAGNRGVIVRDYTGRWPADQPTTEVDLMDPPPIPKLRAGDPDFFETRWEYNADSLPTRVIHPNLNEEVFIYDVANSGRRSQGNLEQHCRLPGPLGSADQPVQICESYEYDDGFGGCCGTNFVTKHVDGRGNETLHTYDSNGNRTHTTHRIPSIVEDFEYNQFGQMTLQTLPDNGSAHRRRDEYTYYDSGIQLGYLHEEIVDALAFALTTTYEYDSLGRVARTIDPRGHDTLYVYNELDQVVRDISREVSDASGVRYERDTFYDANDNVVRVDVQNIDNEGVLQPNTQFTTVYEYDILNFRTVMCQEVGEFMGAIPGTQQVPECMGLPEDYFITTEFAYDANRNRTLVSHGEATNGNQPSNVVQTLYDERDLTFRGVRAPGDPNQSTSQYDYDGNRNRRFVRQGLEGPSNDPPTVIRVTTNAFDGYDRLVSTTDPMGNVTEFQYDANSNRASSRTEGELVDILGDAGNVRLSDMTFIFDPMDRLTGTEVEFFDTDAQSPIDDGKSITQTFFSDNSQVLQVINDNNHVTMIAYDTANRRSRVTDAKGNVVAFEKADGSSGYDENSNVISIKEIEKSDLLNLDETFFTTFVFDNLDRLIQTVDNVGNTHAHAYDSRDNRTVVTDALDHETRYVYDGINRLIKTVRDLNNDGANVDAEPDPDPLTNDPDITTTQSWDDTSRLVGQTDDNGNTTTYVYDALNRMTAEVYADTTVHSYSYDVHHNRLTMTDANGSVASNTYDLLDRLTNKTIVPGTGVSNDTTFEVYKYDGLSRLVHAEDDDSLVTRSFDSLSHVTRETLNGQTTTCGYDGVGNELSSIYPGGREITCTFDELERKKTITDTTGAPNPIADYDYIGPGRVERREYGNGTRTDYKYDGITGTANPTDDFGVKRIIGTNHTRIAGGVLIDDRTYSWDRMYNKTRRKDVRTGGPQLTHDYTYDAIYRLIHTTVTDVSVAAAIVRDTDYDLDGVGNRELVTGTPDPGPYTMDAAQPEPADRPMNQYSTTSFDARQYDKNGNLIALGAPPPEPPPLQPGPNPWAPDPKGGRLNRTGSFKMPTSAAGQNVTIRITLKDLYVDTTVDPVNGCPVRTGGLADLTLFNGQVRYLGPPSAFDDNDLSAPKFIAAELQCTPFYRDWSPAALTADFGAGVDTSTIYYYGAEVFPCSVHEAQHAEQGGLFSNPLEIRTALWGDVWPSAGSFGQVNFTDIGKIVDAFKSIPFVEEPPPDGAPRKVRAMLRENSAPLDSKINFTDIGKVVDAFKTIAYSEDGPVSCPTAATPAAAALAAGTIRYDYRNQMVEFTDTDTGDRHFYKYDALGRRIAKVFTTTEPMKTHYFYDGWQVVEEQDFFGLTQATYVYGLYIDEILNMQRQDSGVLPVIEDFYYHTDDLYNVMALTDAAGAVVERYEYADYGQPIDPATLAPIPGDPSAVGNPYLFTGRRYDPETTWYYYRTRYLDPVAGRFTIRDTIGIWGDLFNIGNAFIYVANSPATRLDPNGTGVCGANIVVGLGTVSLPSCAFFRKHHSTSSQRASAARIGGRALVALWRATTCPAKCPKRSTVWTSMVIIYDCPNSITLAASVVLTYYCECP